MTSLFLSNLLRFILLVLIQAVALNNVHVAGMATPYIFPLFILLLPYSTPMWLLLITSFLTGLSIDFFSGSLGVHAASCTLLAFLRPVIINLVSAKGAEGKQIPRIADFGLAAFSTYIVTALTVYHLTAFFIEIGTFFNPAYTLFKALLSALLAIVLVLVIEIMTAPSPARRQG